MTEDERESCEWCGRPVTDWVAVVSWEGMQQDADDAVLCSPNCLVRWSAGFERRRALAALRASGGYPPPHETDAPHYDAPMAQG